MAASCPQTDYNRSPAETTNSAAFSMGEGKLLDANVAKGEAL